MRKILRSINAVNLEFGLRVFGMASIKDLFYEELPSFQALQASKKTEILGEKRGISSTGKHVKYETLAWLALSNIDLML